MKKLYFTKVNKKITIKDTQKECMFEFEFEKEKQIALCFEVIDENYVDYSYFSLIINKENMNVINDVYIINFDGDIWNKFTEDVIINEFKKDSSSEKIDNIKIIKNDTQVKIVISKDFFLSKNLLDKSSFNIFMYEFFNNKLILVDEILEHKCLVNPQDYLFD